MPETTSTPRFIRSTAGVRTSAQTKGADLEQVINEVNELVGMDAIKEQLDQIIALGRIMKQRRNLDLPTNSISLHMVFMGPPGTGKTEVARKIGKLLKAIGLLKDGDVREVDRSKLVAGYQGQTGLQVRSEIEKAIGGVLFIDEAYSLSGGMDNLAKADSFGEEAITQLVKCMEDYRDRMVVIAAGYTDQMENFLKANPGLNSRFSKKIRFNGYDDKEMFEIFLRMAEKEKYVLDEEAKKEAGKVMRDMYTRGKNDPKFGNARDVRSFFEKVVLTQAERLGYDETFEELPEETRKERLREITEDDVRKAAE
jgi:stage V sporulation protein K